MPRKIEDIITNEPKRSIRNIPISVNRRKSTIQLREINSPAALPSQARAVETVQGDEGGIVERRRLPERRRRAPIRKGPWLAAIAGLVVVALMIMSFLESSVLSYTPKSANLSFNHEIFSAYKTGGNGVLLFSVVKLSDEKSVPVEATGEEQVTRKASGKILVYNNTSDVQKLVKTTRFESSSGKIFRVETDISVPAKNSSGPGSLEVTVVADQAGPEYNIALSDFTLPGLKGTPKFTTIYARSKSSMTGGFSGMEKKVGPDAILKALIDTEGNLNTQLIGEAKAQVPADFVLFSALSTTTYEILPQSASTANTVNINIRGNYYGVIFKRVDLVSYLKSKKLAVLESQAIKVPELENLQLAFVGDVPDDLLKISQISFDVSGDVLAVWVTDENALKRDLAGRKKNDISAVLTNYPSVAKAEAVLKPFWKTTFPDETSSIELKELPLK